MPIMIRSALSADVQLGRSWGLKEALREAYRKTGQGGATAALERWIKEAQESGLRPFRRMARTLKKWHRKVLNHWRYQITNALVERKQNRVKVLERRAYGCRNDRSFLLRIGAVEKPSAAARGSTGSSRGEPKLLALSLS